MELCQILTRDFLNGLPGSLENVRLPKIEYFVLHYGARSQIETRRCTKKLVKQVREVTRQREERKWEPPIGAIAFDELHSRLGSGIVARSALGTVLVSRSILHVEVGTVFAAEAFACSWAILIGLEMGFTFIRLKHASYFENQLAYFLAKESLRSGKGFYLEDVVPSYAMRTMKAER
ncbi:hypothetical protein Goklo_001072, partial [Gossypium klotzschianum]|nr:hypothetical protein [Gossypium klotzschianum]